MNLTFERNLFTQIGLDSGALTMLGGVIHSFQEPGEYRGSVRKEGEGQAVFYVLVDKNSPVAQVNIDLAALTRPSDTSSKNCRLEDSPNQFSVNPKGYAVFHVSEGAGGYNVHVRKAEENPETKIFDSRTLSDGDIFSATIIRPGTYSVVNMLTKAQGQLVVSYPEIGNTPYRPPGPIRVQVAQEHFEPQHIKLKPGQGLLFECNTPSRIRIELQRPDDGPDYPRQATPRRWKKSVPPETAA